MKSLFVAENSRVLDFGEYKYKAIALGNTRKETFRRTVPVPWNITEDTLLEVGLTSSGRVRLITSTSDKGWVIFVSTKSLNPLNREIGQLWVEKHDRLNLSVLAQGDGTLEKGLKYMDYLVCLRKETVRLYVRKVGSKPTIWEISPNGVYIRGLDEHEQVLWNLREERLIPVSLFNSYKRLVCH